MNGLLLYNARVLTLDADQPTAEAVAVRGGTIVAVGGEAACRRAAPARARLIDCGARTVIPGIIDAHVHLLAWSAALVAVDCSAARSIDEIVARLRHHARDLPPGVWVRAAGYDESRLAEGRHPSRWDLDRATSTHPVRLLHRSGHALVLNSLGLARAGITIASEEPPGGVIDRRLNDGEPSGLLLEMGEIVSSAVPPLPQDDLVVGLRDAGRRLLAAGVTAVLDMTHTNNELAIQHLRAISAEAGFAPRWDAVEGWPGQAGRLSRLQGAPVKVMLREAGGGALPGEAELARIIRACRERNRPVAVHAVARPSVDLAVGAFEAAGVTGPDNRIEHAGVCMPATAARIAALGLTVVSNPAFLWFSGERYLKTVPERELPHLYDAAGLLAAGVRVAAGSDAPVTPPAPLAAMHAAASRRGHTGAQLPGAGIAPHDALALHTAWAAAAVGAQRNAGRIAPGCRADLVITDGEPGTAAATPAVTILDGRIRWSGCAAIAVEST